ncbi:acetyltransferase [Pedobacter sp. KBW01]|uniref:acetyltransferase n=1 Tax=Pedobacter sp. KBW01 TaxID=2153364 RepID=UPI000F5A417B|nr:acetyltransferase [Pedobacter sp. KBW01]RQO65710.1 acetyltransferase [Pedobacter sp. KBW01]
MNIIGASGHAKIIIDILEELKISIEAVWDDDVNRKAILGYPINGKIFDFKNYSNNDCLIAIGNNVVRKKIADIFFGTPFATICHPKANISKYVTIGNGTIINSGATINADVGIGVHVIVNTNASIDHDCVIGDYVHISPNVALAGNVTVMEGAQIGIGASIIQGIKIGKWATIGAGSVIIRDVPDYGVIVGVPGKLIKYNNNNEE